MSEQDLQTVRDQYEAVNERDWDRAIGAYADDVRMEIRTFGITGGSYAGVKEVADWFTEWFRSFDRDLRFEITELTELDDGRILIVADNFARGRSSGIELRDEVVWTYRFRDGKIVELVAHESRDKAVADSA